MKKVLVLFLMGLFLTNLSFAKDKLSQRGVLISSINNVSGNDIKVPDVWGGVSLDGKEDAPISAKLVKNSSTNWELTATNNSNDKYSFTLEFLQFTNDGKQIKKNIFPFSLAPKTSKTEKIVPSSRGDDYMVNIVSWKKFDVKKKSNKSKKSLKK